MRFTSAWSEVLSQNLTLRVMLLSLSATAIFISILAIQLGFREPIIIERSCYSKMVGAASTQHSKEEIDAFVRLALSQRFDFGVEPSPEIISAEELGFKKQEQQDLASKNMIQKVLVGSVQVNGETIKVEVDRIIAVGQIRSALAFPLTVTVASTTRTASNPYGLMATRVSQLSVKEKSQ